MNYLPLSILAINPMIIDEEKKFPLTSYLNRKVTHSDHFTIIIDFDIKFINNKV